MADEKTHSTACSMNAAVHLGADCVCGAIPGDERIARRAICKHCDEPLACNMCGFDAMEPAVSGVPQDDAATDALLDKLQDAEGRLRGRVEQLETALRELLDAIGFHASTHPTYGSEYCPICKAAARAALSESAGTDAH